MTLLLTFCCSVKIISRNVWVFLLFFFEFEATSKRKHWNELPCHRYLEELKNETRRWFITFVCLQMMVWKVTWKKRLPNEKIVYLVEKKTFVGQNIETLITYDKKISFSFLNTQISLLKHAVFPVRKNPSGNLSVTSQQRKLGSLL